MNLVEARKLSGLSLQQVADRYNVSKSSVYLWERTEREKGVSQPIANLIAMDLVRQSFPTKIDWYTRCCLLFAEDTANREALNRQLFYTTYELNGWRETPHNEHGGIDVSWAFHLDPDEIKAKATNEFLAIVANELDNVDVKDPEDVQDCLRYVKSLLV